MRTTRIRRGREVVIPEEWRGKVTDRQTIRKRQSKLTKKLRRRYPNRGTTIDRVEARAPTVEEWDG